MSLFKSTFFQMNEDILRDVESSFRVWKRKSKVLVSRGKHTDKLFFINKGFVLLKITLNHKQWVRHIAQPGEFIASLSGFETGKSCEESIETIGECEIIYIEKHILSELRRKYPEVDRIYTDYITNALLQCQRRIEDLLCLEAEQYYEKLLKEKSAVMNAIPQYELASYLGIQPQSLSRIRGKFKYLS
ncbi:MAG: Crp/Fnr family transcriptional regulator [Bacteroidota bacterium]